MGRPEGKGNMPEAAIEKIRGLLFVNEKLSGKQLKEYVETELGINYDLRSYQNVKKQELPTIQAEKNKELDVPWQTSTLRDNPIPPGSIAWLITIQALRKQSYSKPLTIREAIWFSRLSGFRELLSTLSQQPYSKMVPNKKNIFISHIIATWAQMYAYREKLDIIANIKKPDYSDLDSYIVNDNSKAIIEYNGKRLMEVTQGIGERGDIPDDYVKKFKTQFMLPALIDHIRVFEIYLLSHCLGDPDMSDNSFVLYYVGLVKAIFKTAFSERLIKLSYTQKTGFLQWLRKWAKETPDADVSMIDPTIGKILEFVEKDGE